MSSYKRSVKKDLIREAAGEEQLNLMQQLKKVKQMTGVPQARMPFSVDVN
ncbi:MAG: hypothetical protein NVSMB63_07820 [Sediminibacterium sp.]